MDSRASRDDRVRADLAQLAAQLAEDSGSAPDVPPSVTERVVAALRAAPPPERRGSRAAIRLGAAVGAAAAVGAVVLGTVMLTRTELAPPRPATAQHLTAEPPTAAVPLSDPEIVGLLSRRPALGPLGDPRRRASCLSGLGYPASAEVLGGRQVEIQGESAVLLVLAGDTPDTLVALAVRPNCSSADTGLLADTQVRRA